MAFSKAPRNSSLANPQPWHQKILSQDEQQCTFQPKRTRPQTAPSGERKQRIYGSVTEGSHDVLKSGHRKAKKLAEKMQDGIPSSDYGRRTAQPPQPSSRALYETYKECTFRPQLPEGTKGHVLREVVPSSGYGQANVSVKPKPSEDQLKERYTARSGKRDDRLMEGRSKYDFRPDQIKRPLKQSVQLKDSTPSSGYGSSNYHPPKQMRGEEAKRALQEKNMIRPAPSFKPNLHLSKNAQRLARKVEEDRQRRAREAREAYEAFEAQEDDATYSDDIGTNDY
eukprot:m.27486 g.27486  ORF g.27486 m.27486 type:complete len:282 (+) comp7898_c0_seq3:95-940(+)